MAFMIPCYVLGDWFEVDTIEAGTVTIPADCLDADNMRDFRKDGDAVSITYRTKKYGARLSAPGYMDCTDWDLFDTLEKAQAHIRDTYDVDPDTGEDLDDDDNTD